MARRSTLTLTSLAMLDEVSRKTSKPIHPATFIGMMIRELDIYTASVSRPCTNRPAANGSLLCLPSKNAANHNLILASLFMFLPIPLPWEPSVWPLFNPVSYLERKTVVDKDGEDTPRFHVSVNVGSTDPLTLQTLEMDYSYDMCASASVSSRLHENCLWEVHRR